MILTNKKAKGIPKKNLVPDFNYSEWFQDVTALGGVVEVDPSNTHKMKLTITAGAQGRLIWIPVEIGKTYTLSFTQCTGLYRAYSGAVRFHSDAKWLNKNLGTTSITFTVDASYGGYMTLRFTAGSAGYYYFENFQLEEGSVATNFEPYGEINKKASLVSQKNKILPFTSPKWQLHANAKVIDENTLELNATAANQFSMVDLYLKPNTNYVISMGQCDGVYKINDDKATAISATYNQKGTVAFNSGNTKKVTLFFYSTGAGKFIFKNPMIEEGYTATPFKEYEEGAKGASLIPQKNLIDFSEKGMRVYGGSPPTKLTWKSGRVSFDSVGNYSGIQPIVSPTLEVGKAYSFSFKGHNLRLVANYGTLVGTSVVYDGNKTTLTFTPTKSTGFLAIENSSLTNASCWAEEVQLELGNVSTAYELYNLVNKKSSLVPNKVPKKNYLLPLTKWIAQANANIEFLELTERKATFTVNNASIYSGLEMPIDINVFNLLRGKQVALSVKNYDKGIYNGQIQLRFFGGASGNTDFVIGSAGQVISKTVPTDFTSVFLRVQTNASGYAKFTVEDLQLELGSSATDYDIYQLVNDYSSVIKKAPYRNYPFTYQRESIEILNGVQYGMNNPRIKNGGIFIEEGLTNTVSGSDKVTELKVINNAYGQVTYNHNLPRKLVVQSTDNAYTLQFEMKAVGTNAKPWGSIVVGAMPAPKDNWSWRLYSKDYLPSEIVDLGDGWKRYTKTFTIKGTTGEYLQSFIKFICEVAETDIDSFIRNVQIEEKPYATTYTTGFRKNDNLQIPVSFDKLGGSIDIEFEYKKLENTVQYIFDTNPEERWLIYKEKDDTWVVYTGGAGRGLFTAKPVEGKNVINVTWTADSIQVYLNGVRVINSSHVLAGLQNKVYFGQRYTLGNHLNNSIYSFVVKDHNGNIQYKI